MRTSLSCSSSCRCWLQRRCPSRSQGEVNPITARGAAVEPPAPACAGTAASSAPSPAPTRPVSRMIGGSAARGDGRPADMRSGDGSWPLHRPQGGSLRSGRSLPPGSELTVLARIDGCRAARSARPTTANRASPPDVIYLWPKARPVDVRYPRAGPAWMGWGWELAPWGW